MHKELMERLKGMHPKIPHLLIYGPPGSGKKVLVKQFINWLYDGNTSNHVVYVNCAHVKGIKFIREDLKSFAKTNTLERFKSIVMWNADQLTPDAQSALRRCIEIFSNHTRFFMVTEDKYKLLKPILSRFSQIYVPLIHYEGPCTEIPSMERFYGLTDDTLLTFVKELYNEAYQISTMIDLLSENMDTIPKYKFLVQYDVLRLQCRNDKVLMTTMLYFYLHPECIP